MGLTKYLYVQPLTALCLLKAQRTCEGRAARVPARRAGGYFDAIDEKDELLVAPAPSGSKRRGAIALSAPPRRTCRVSPSC